MTRLSKARPLFLAAGGAALVGILLGARHLGPGGGGTDTSKAPPAAGGKDVGTVVIGTVDSDPPPARYGLPPVLQSGQVVDVFVKQGDAVKAGDKLYRFNSTIPEAKLTEAERAVDMAKAKADTARGAAAQHAKKVDLQKQVVTGHDAQVKLALQAWELGEYNLKEGLKAQGIPDKYEERRKTDVKLFELSADYEAKKVTAAVEKAKLADLEAAKANQVDKLIAEADAAVKQYEAVVEEARATVEMCTVRARLDGSVERVSVSPGDVMGLGSTAPALILIPAGPRVVRGEIEAEFAHRFGKEWIDRDVTIHDFTDPRLTYPGKVRGIGNAFLPKRANEGAIVQNETRSLEAVIEVIDPAPAGKPPLRFNQKVRVVFPTK
jgi:multidrug resistance efflux pump